MHLNGSTYIAEIDHQRGRTGKQRRKERMARKNEKFEIAKRLAEEATDPLLKQAFIDWMVRSSQIHLGRQMTFIYPGAPKPTQAFCHKSQWLRQQRDYSEPQCLFVPHMYPGRPAMVKFNYRSMSAARAMLTLTAGARDTHQHATHRCGHGHLSCVNPRHLEWGTSGENKRDMALHNSPVIMTGHLSKYDIDEIQEAVEMEGVLAHRFKTTLATIQQLRA